MQIIEHDYGFDAMRFHNEWYRLTGKVLAFAVPTFNGR